jgi:hypothetical protein
MGNSLEHVESAEVLVQPYENSPLLEGKGQNSFVARVLFPIAAPNYVIPSGATEPNRIRPSSANLDSLEFTSPNGGVKPPLHQTETLPSHRDI